MYKTVFSGIIISSALVCVMSVNDCAAYTPQEVYAQNLREKHLRQLEANRKQAENLVRVAEYLEANSEALITGRGFSKPPESVDVLVSKEQQAFALWGQAVTAERSGNYQAAYDTYTKALEALPSAGAVHAEYRGQLYANRARVCEKISRITGDFSMFRKAEDDAFSAELLLHKKPDGQLYVGPGVTPQAPSSRPIRQTSPSVRTKVTTQRQDRPVTRAVPMVQKPEPVRRLTSVPVPAPAVSTTLPPYNPAEELLSILAEYEKQVKKVEQAANRLVVNRNGDIAESLGRISIQTKQLREVQQELQQVYTNMNESVDQVLPQQKTRSSASYDVRSSGPSRYGQYRD